MPMPAILVSDDARGWYESGPVKDLTIRRNLFVECGSPVIAVWPEIDRFGKHDHSNIAIENNRFIIREGIAVDLRASENIVVRDNVFDLAGGFTATAESLIKAENCENVTVDSNRTGVTP